MKAGRTGSPFLLTGIIVSPWELIAKASMGSSFVFVATSFVTSTKAFQK
jgi:hypothetical protein